MGLKWICGNDRSHIYVLDIDRSRRCTLLKHCIQVGKRKHTRKSDYIEKWSSSLKPFHPQNEKIPHFRELSETKRVTLRTKIIEGLPDNMPRWFADLGLEGLWVLLGEIPCAQPIEGNILRRGSYTDLRKGLENLLELLEKEIEELKWVRDLMDYLIICEKKESRVILLFTV